MAGFPEGDRGLVGALEAHVSYVYDAVSRVLPLIFQFFQGLILLHQEDL